MKTFNLDKLVIGVLLGVCLMLAIGAGGLGRSHSVGTFQHTPAEQGHIRPEHSNRPGMGIRQRYRLGYSRPCFRHRGNYPGVQSRLQE